MTIFRLRHYCSKLFQSLVCTHSDYWCSCSIVGLACSSQDWDCQSQMAHSAHQYLTSRPRPNSILYRSDFAVSFLNLADWSFSIHCSSWKDSSFLFLSSEVWADLLLKPYLSTWTYAETQNLLQDGTHKTYARQAEEYLKYWSLFQFRLNPCECLGSQARAPYRIYNYPLMDSNWFGWVHWYDSLLHPPVWFHRAWCSDELAHGSTLSAAMLGRQMSRWRMKVLGKQN